MRFHMARFERRGYGSFRSPERHRFYRMSVLSPAVAVLFLAVAVFAVAQDVNVHIEPRKSDPANAAGKPDAAAAKPDKDSKDTAPDQKTHTKPILVDVDLV